MKRNISLYIAGTKVDLDDNSLILFNYAMTDLTNPTIVKNSYSHQVKLKGTKTNNKLFGEIFRLDRQTIYSDGYTGVNFDPMRKTPFEIYDETSTCLESGYVKLNSISRNGADISYNVTLYGGLGSFLYGLSYNTDGSKKSLLDLVYPDAWNETIDFHGYTLGERGKYTYKHVVDAWDVMCGRKSPGAVVMPFWDIINFAPAYNGFPKDFDSNKAIHIYNQFQNSKYKITDPASGITYNTRSDAGGYVLTTFTHNHTEWEMRDLRWYLQRPIISMKKIIDAICLPENNGGYSVELDRNFFTKENPYYGYLWLTLPMIATEDRISNSSFIPNLLKTTNSPADYFLSYAKMLGLIIVCDTKSKVVRIMQRKTWYDKSVVVDLTNRINIDSSISIQPVAVDAKIYQLGGNVEGEFAEDYKESFGFPYGVKRINTGFEFDENRKVLTDSIVFKDAVEVLERNRMFIYLKGTGLTSYTFPLPAYEVVETELWGSQSSTSTEKSEKFQLAASVNENSSAFNYINPNIPYGDQFSKVQLHKHNNEALDGANVLLFFDKEYESTNRPWLVTQDIDEQSVLNGEKPCWNLSPDSAGQLYKIPMFRRFLQDTKGNIAYSLDYGEPLSIGVPNAIVQPKGNIYYKFWQSYLQDLYNGNTKVMTCKVNLRGLQVNDNLLGKFFWFENSYWVLYKISNYSITTFDDAECEFVRVNDKNNYLK